MDWMQAAERKAAFAVTEYSSGPYLRVEALLSVEMLRSRLFEKTPEKAASLFRPLTFF
jgi:hypothetical protein